MVPTTRDEFKEYVLRKVGKTAIGVRVTEEQLDDRVDEALRFWYDYHWDGAEKSYYKYVLTQDDFDNRYVTLPENIIGAVRLFDTSVAYGNVSNPFNLQYQFAMSELFTLGSVSTVPYFMTMTHFAELQQLLIGQVPIRFNRHTHRLYLDMNWEKYSPGDVIVVEAFEIVDPETWSYSFSDRLLQNYCAALVRHQQAVNLGTHRGMQMMNGVSFNADKMFDDSQIEIEKIEQEIKDASMPVGIMIG